MYLVQTYYRIFILSEFKIKIIWLLHSVIGHSGDSGVKPWSGLIGGMHPPSFCTVTLIKELGRQKLGQKVWLKKQSSPNVRLADRNMVTLSLVDDTGNPTHLHPRHLFARKKSDYLLSSYHTLQVRVHYSWQPLILTAYCTLFISDRHKLNYFHSIFKTR